MSQHQDREHAPHLRICDTQPRFHKGVAHLLVDCFLAEAETLDAVLQRLATVLDHPARGAMVAVYCDRDGVDKVIGFVDNFMTETPSGIKRWEIDLLAVDSKWQGLGIGSALVEKSFAEAEARRANLTRALVRVDNVACQHAFTRNGFGRIEPTFGLFVGSEAGGGIQAQLPDYAYPVHVETCLYRGCWVEKSKGNLTVEDLERARSYLHRLDQAAAEIIGGLVPREHDDENTVTRPKGYDLVGHYEWWVRQA
ncbi:hypothetical protein BKA67DRAFT_665584 [Truncatella angustata]|uniref:N-acetyltransferase domain-containing protein n=1 Tax=Truncatella angustata TaxID=152316 RepID=A0A9P8REG7_9PEZI|nr:uncharacterized protein BKA67DRAFT_665584 [Truncatella angustata]KAH6638639.1 hypothetical protein BKA67DRAFT_665584 [Truncatella angustata]